MFSSRVIWDKKPQNENFKSFSLIPESRENIILLLDNYNNLYKNLNFEKRKFNLQGWVTKKDGRLQKARFLRINQSPCFKVNFHSGKFQPVQYGMIRFLLFSEYISCSCEEIFSENKRKRIIPYRTG